MNLARVGNYVKIWWGQFFVSQFVPTPLCCKDYFLKNASSEAHFYDIFTPCLSVHLKRVFLSSATHTFLRTKFGSNSGIAETTNPKIYLQIRTLQNSIRSTLIFYNSNISSCSQLYGSLFTAKCSVLILTQILLLGSAVLNVLF